MISSEAKAFQASKMTLLLAYCEKCDRSVLRKGDGNCPSCNTSLADAPVKVAGLEPEEETDGFEVERVELLKKLDALAESGQIWDASKKVEKARKFKKRAARLREWIKVFCYGPLVIALLTIVFDSLLQRVSGLVEKLGVPGTMVVLLLYYGGVIVLSLTLQTSYDDNDRWGMRFQTQGAIDTLRTQRARPHLYLRSMSVDGLSGFQRVFANRSFEEMALAFFGNLGPIVAIGAPGEEAPELGAARLYAKNEVWQEVVELLMAYSGLVILRPGMTEGVGWEVSKSIETVNPRLLFLLVRKKDYQAVLGKHGDKFPKGLPASIRKDTIIVFDEAWTPSLIEDSDLPFLKEKR